MAEYTTAQLTVLEGLDAVRKRPGMYLGSTDTAGLTHCVFELVDNAVDEALAGFGSLVTVVLHRDGSVSVSDNGRGIPVDVDPVTGLSGVELVLTKLHAGGKFGDSGYKVAGGLHGVGASAVNAVSDRFDVTVVRDSARWHVSFKHGKPGVFAQDGPDGKFTPEPGVRRVGRAAKAARGTTVRFWPDRSIFAPDAVVDVAALCARATATSHLVDVLRITVVDELSGVVHEFTGDGGLPGFVGGVDVPERPVVVSGTGTYRETVQQRNGDGELVPVEVERTLELACVFGWSSSEANVRSFVNIVDTPAGGTHVKAFERALVKFVTDQLKSTRGLLKSTETPPSVDDARDGLQAVVAVRIPEPRFAGQTKQELSMPEVSKLVADLVADGVHAWFSTRGNKKELRPVLERVVAAARARAAAREARELGRKTRTLTRSALPAKLVDCVAVSRPGSELIICEGDSAAGGIKQCRDATWQAVLPIRGKILNVQKASLKQMLDNVECASIIQVLGAGSGESFDLAAARYDRCLIVADADVDGLHITTLLITLFARYLRPFVDAGRLFVATPPLYRIDLGSDEVRYVFSDAERDAVVTQLAKSRRAIRGISRFKGLGEMDPGQLWETTLDPQRRTLRRIDASDVTLSESVLELAMGTDVAARRDWISQEGAKVDKEAIDV